MFECLFGCLFVCVFVCLGMYVHMFVCVCVLACSTDLCVFASRHEFWRVVVLILRNYLQW